MSRKIVSIEGIVGQIPRPTVMCHGCFDVLHIGHVRHLQEAKRNGITLVVSVTADAYVGKGDGRPIFTAAERAEMLAALECVDYVVINDGPNSYDALRFIKPDFYVKGIDYKGTDCEEFQIAKSIGAKMVFTNTEKFSTTELIERLQK